MRSRSLDLQLAAGLSLATIVAAWAGAPLAVCAILGVPLVLLAPGYVWTDVFFASRLSPELRAVLSVALSLALTALGGILLAAGGVRLDRASWLVLLAGMTVAGAAVAETVRRRVPVAPPVRPREHPQTPRLSVAQALRLGAAALLCAAAVGVAVHSASAQEQPKYTQLTLAQQEPALGTAQIVVGNLEQGVQRYRVEVSTDGVVSQRWTITVADGASWQQSVPARPGHRLAVDVYRTVSGGPRYRHVAITVPVAPGR